MKTLHFKTNIKCAGCIVQVTPVLNKTVGENNWTVDIQHPDKILTVSAENLQNDAISLALERSGFKAEAMLE